jgi:biotin operon repressor
MEVLMQYRVEWLGQIYRCESTPYERLCRARIVPCVSRQKDWITQDALAATIGTTRSRVSYFMNRFRQRGFIGLQRPHPGPQVAAGM